MTLYQGYHDFIYINDFVRGIDFILKGGHDLPSGDIVNFGSGIQTSNFELLEIWENITGKTAPVAKVAELSKAFENNVWICDTTKANSLGFECEYDLETGINDFIFKANYDIRATN
jgi:nucleoside-diphosphate-sugar epimerase